MKQINYLTILIDTFIFSINIEYNEIFIIHHQKSISVVKIIFTIIQN